MTAIRSVDIDEVRVRSLQPIPSAAPVPVVHSSIAKAEGEIAVPQLRPKLSQPHIMYALIDSHMETERLADKSAKIFELEATKNLADIEKLATEKQEALENEAKAVQSRDTWSTLANIAQYVAGVGTIVLGAACGGWPGGLLIASGVIGVGNRVIHDTNLVQASVEWITQSKELQTSIAQKIEMGAFFLQMGLGLAGGVGATGAFAAVAVAGGIIKAGTDVGVEFHKKRISDFEARLKEINYQITANNHTLSQDTTQISKMLETVESKTNEIRKAIRNLETSQD